MPMPVVRDDEVAGRGVAGHVRPLGGRTLPQRPVERRAEILDALRLTLLFAADRLHDPVQDVFIDVADIADLAVWLSAEQIRQLAAAAVDAHDRDDDLVAGRFGFLRLRLADEVRA